MYRDVNLLYRGVNLLHRRIVIFRTPNTILRISGDIMAFDRTQEIDCSVFDRTQKLRTIVDSFFHEEEYLDTLNCNYSLNLRLSRKCTLGD